MWKGHPMDTLGLSQISALNDMLTIGREIAGLSQTFLLALNRSKSFILARERTVFYDWKLVADAIGAEKTVVVALQWTWHQEIYSIPKKVCDMCGRSPFGKDYLVF
jgi:hypothetical protein